MASSTAEAYVDAGQKVKELGDRIEKAKRDMQRAQEVLNDIGDDYEAAQESLRKITENYGDPLGLLSPGPMSRARAVAGSNSVPGTTRGKNPAAIVKALNEAPGPLAAGILIEKAQANGGGSTASLNQAIGKMFKDGKIKRDGTRGSYLYSLA
jgi:hypothetical protein